MCTTREREVVASCAGEGLGGVGVSRAAARQAPLVWQPALRVAGVCSQREALRDSPSCHRQPSLASRTAALRRG